ncbi:MAG TPA: protein kinase [Gemmatimonadales bacterium]|nr:protein kinase [Gemmatimonadales bacterium]
MTNGVLECYRCRTPVPESSRYCSSCGADVSGGGAPPTTSNTELLQQRLQRLIEGKYRIDRLLGKGGMGAVFLAHDLTLEREVAIKVLPPDVAQDDQIVRRFQQEAKTAAKLDHPNIIPIYRVESEGGLNYFVMKYVSGTSLEDLLERQEPIPVAEIQRILWEAARALGHAHQRGVVHRDVKPANIMFDHDGRVMLTDFGISKALQAATGFTATGMIIGTPHYMAPEQAKGQTVDGRADQYSLGVVGYRMIAGELPFVGDSVHTILYKHIFEEAPRAAARRADAPEHLSAAVARAMAKEPHHRYPTMEEFATAAWPEQPVAVPAKGRPGIRAQHRITADSPTEITGAPTTPLPKALPGARTTPKPAPKRSRAGLVVGVVVVTVAGVGGYLVLGRTGSAGNPESRSAAPPAPAVDTVLVRDTVRDTVRVPVSVAPVEPPPQRRANRSRPRETKPPVTPPPAAVAAQGFLTIAAEPFGQVYIDGVDVGQTPVVEYAVKPGRHTIRIERPGFKTVTETVLVDANNTVRKRYTLLPE